MVVAQLAERLPLLPEVLDSNPDISKIYVDAVLIFTVEKSKIKRKGRESSILIGILTNRKNSKVRTSETELKSDSVKST